MTGLEEKPSGADMIEGKSLTAPQSSFRSTASPSLLKESRKHHLEARVGLASSPYFQIQSPHDPALLHNRGHLILSSHESEQLMLLGLFHAISRMKRSSFLSRCDSV